MKKSLGERLRDLRGNESQVAFCNKIEQKQGTYSAWERDEKDPSSSAIALICRATGVSSDWLLGLTDETPKALESRHDPILDHQDKGVDYWRTLAISQQETISKLTALLAEGRAIVAAPVRTGGRGVIKTA